MCIRDSYEGHADLEVSVEALDTLASGDPIPTPQEELYPNEYVRLHAPSNGKRTVLGRTDSEVRRIIPLRRDIHDVRGLEPRNMQQHFALDALLDESVQLVTLMGKAGTGKTLLALGAGLHAVLNTKSYARMLVARPLSPVGRDVGYLPGGIEDKLHPWMQPVYDLSLIHI